jgi:CarD family transcriptional regulator
MGCILLMQVTRWSGTKAMAQKKKTPSKTATKATTSKRDTKSSTIKASAKAAPSKSAKVEKHPAVKSVAAKASSAVSAKAAAPKPHVAKPVNSTSANAAVSKLPKPAASISAATVAGATVAGMVAARHTPASVARTIPSAVTTPVSQTITAPAASASPAVAPTPVVADAGPRKAISTRHGFKTNEWIVYPSHGVGRIVAIEEQEIAGMALELFVITFDKDKMTLRVPTGKSQSVGMRKLADDGIVKRAMETLKGRARIKRTMWSRRAQEFEAKINSGDLVSIAEVVRDLFRADNQPEQSYSERQLYEAALDRMTREIAACEKTDERGASQRITEILTKSAKGRRAAADEAAAAETKAA